MRLLALLAVLLPSLAGAQGVVFGTNVYRGSFLHDYEYWTSATLNFYVETTGNDLNDCLSVSTPCLTLQAAVDKTPKLVRAPVTYNVGQGNFTGADLSGFTFDYAFAPASGAYVQIAGTLKNATVATGSATGTATGASAGGCGVANTLTDTSQTWTVDDLQGKLLVITGGSGAGGVSVIRSNTADTVTIAGLYNGTPTAGSTYAIQDWGTVFDTEVTGPLSSLGYSLSGDRIFIFSGSPIGVSPPFDLRNVQVEGAGVYIAGAQVNVFQTRFQTLDSVAFQTCAETQLSLFRSSAELGGNDIFLTDESCTNGGLGTLDAYYSYVYGSGSGFEFTYPVQSADLFGNTFEDLAFAVYTNRAGNFSIGCGWFDTLTTAAVDVGRASFNSGFAAQPGAAHVLLGGGAFTDCAIGVRVTGAALLDETSATSGSGNTTLYSIYDGGKIRVNASSTASGTTDIDIDGNAFTRAALQALSPKRITDLSTLSSIWEP